MACDMKVKLFVFTAILLTACSCKAKQADAHLSTEKDASEVVPFISNLYTSQIFGTTAVDPSCFTDEVVESLRDAYDYETDQDPKPMAIWDLRTGANGEKMDSSYESTVESVTWVGDGWWRVEYLDMGWKGITELRCEIENGKPRVSDYRCVYSEPDELYKSMYPVEGTTASDVQGCWQQYFDPKNFDAGDSYVINIIINGNDIAVHSVGYFDVGMRLEGTAVFTESELDNIGNVLIADCTVTDMDSNDVERLSLWFQKDSDALLTVGVAHAEDHAEAMGLGSQIYNFDTFNTDKKFARLAPNCQEENPTIYNVLRDVNAFEHDPMITELLANLTDDYFPTMKDNEGILQVNYTPEYDLATYYDPRSELGLGARLYRPDDKQLILMVSDNSTCTSGSPEGIRFFTIDLTHTPRMIFDWGNELLSPKITGSEAHPLEIEMMTKGNTIGVLDTSLMDQPDKRMKILTWNGTRFE